MQALEDIAPRFVEVAHRIVWATVGTVTPAGDPRTRILHPLWEWDGTTLVGWIATSPLSPKRRDLAHVPKASITYWDASQDTCTADCDVTWVPDVERRALWGRFVAAPAPVGYDPSIIPGWTSPDVEAFGGLRLTPTHLRLLPGSLLLRGEGELLTWRR